MFTVYHSNQLDLLKTLTASLIAGRPLRNPFQPEIILVQNNGMAKWMQMELAKKIGIAANIEFPLPASFIWQMFTRVFPDIPNKSIFVKPVMTWRLMILLPRLFQRPDFGVIRDYLRNDADKQKSFQFAARMAELFDQYIIYRPDWLDSWQRGELIDGLSKAQRWQALLWKALVEETEQAGESLWHRGNLCQRFIKNLTESHTRPLGLPDRIFVCGISALPPIYLQTLQALGRYIDIHLLFTNPCRYYWGDICDRDFFMRLLHRRRQHYRQKTKRGLFRNPKKAYSLFDELGKKQTGNPLLSSWGKQGRDNLYLLTQMDSIAEVDAFVNLTGNNLLSLLQRDILMLEDHTVTGVDLKASQQSCGKRLLQPNDCSLKFHICHSQQREVEVLHDSLLAMITEDPALQPSDIIVMAADIDHYTPAIQAVFGNVGGDRALPFDISDRRARYLHPILSTFLTLLELPHSRFTAEQVLTLLEVPELAARFSINEQELQLLRKWVVESGIRWGLDDNTMRELMLPVTGQHTWQFGLTRMLLGYAMDGDIGDWQGILPYNESHGSIARLVGNLAEFLSRLRRWRDRLTKPQPLRAWLGCAREINEDFFTADTEAEEALSLLENQWKELIECGLQVKYDQLVPVALLKNELTARLDQERVSQRFLTGTITFCTLMPMRSIPFRVVCLLGMNDGIYPRTLSLTGFDLMAQHPRRGDRSRRDDDRYLFLEALISAQQRFYVSFIGRAIQDNSLRYPCVLVSELSDYIVQNFCLPGDEHIDVESSAERMRTHLWQWHSRIPFAPENFLPNSENQSFAKEWLPAAGAKGKPHSDFVVPLTVPPYEVLTLDELIQFYHYPVRAWFMQRLLVSFHKTSIELAASEPFVVDKLTCYQLNNRLVNALINGENTDRLFIRMRAAGLLPYGAFGELYWAKQCQEMSKLAERVQQWRLPETCSIEVNLILGNVTLTGWLHHVQKNGLLRWHPGVLSARDGLLLWLEHLVYCAMGGEGDSRIFGVRSKWHFTLLPVSQAKAFLISMISGYFQGMKSPLLLLPFSGGAWLNHCYDRTTHRIDRSESRQKQALDKLIKAWHGNAHVSGEGKDFYLKRLIRQLDQQNINAIISAAERYFLPLFMFNVD